MEHNKLRRPFKTEQVENNWAISYGDMITLLLGFFVIFFNIKTDTININLIKKDLDKYFNEGQKQSQLRTPSANGVSNGKETVPVLTSNIQNVLKIKSNIEGEKILVEFPGVSFFNSASDVLTKEGQEALTDFSKAIIGHLGLFRLVVRGYTDNKPVKSNHRYKDNLELSAFRSISAIRYLAGEGINLENMRIAGYGESSLSRQAVEDKQSSEQRKIVIVIEPLDHTERAPRGKKEAFSRPKKTIERVAEAVIPGQDFSTIIGEDSFWNLILEVPEYDDVVYNANECLFWVDRLITENVLYQSFLQYLVELKVKKRRKAEQEVKDLVSEYKDK